MKTNTAVLKSSPVYRKGSIGASVARDAAMKEVHQKLNSMSPPDVRELAGSLGINTSNRGDMERAIAAKLVSQGMTVVDTFSGRIGRVV